MARIPEARMVANSTFQSSPVRSVSVVIQHQFFVA
jgi:hypothetical protein